MTLKELEAYRNDILQRRAEGRKRKIWTSQRDAVEGARAVLGMCYINRAIAERVGCPVVFRKVFPRLP